MVLQLDSWAVAGAQSSARIARLQLQSASRSGNGVVTTSDLRVRPLAVPGTSVRIDSGAAVVLGREQQFQGSYYAHNIGEDTIPISPTGSGSGRTDMVILRVEDPSIDGTPWTHDPATEPVYYFRVLEGVSPTAVDLPAGMTGIPLARITLPASTGTITAGMITDLRQQANPRTEYVLLTQRGGSQSTTPGDWDEAGNITRPDWERWPQHDWTTTIPEWATQVIVDAEWANAYLKPTGSVAGTSDAIGDARVGLVGGPDGPLYVAAAGYNANQTSTTNGYRTGFSNYGRINIPAAWRGLTVDVRMYVSGNPGSRGRLVADARANFKVGLQFVEVPVAAASL